MKSLLPPSPQPWPPAGVKPYYYDSSTCIIHGDCRDILPLLEPVDLVLTDPPYPGFSQVRYSPIPELPKCRQFIFYPPLLTFPLDFTARHVWHKPNGNSSQHYEFVYERNGLAICRVFRTAAILPNYSQYKLECEAHPTQKPIKLINQLLQLAKNATLILDPFVGSGTTLRAAKDLNRKAIGIEIEERYCEIVAKRMAQEVLPFNGTSTNGQVRTQMHMESENTGQKRLWEAA